ncbi:ferredoxin [Actinosynnema sp. NPDC020468]|uniref:ferredoxin n=1 Tax=Actinosynnema sp. NPDC020468 TaxID=3154488 RepID=UPI0033C68C25
MTWHVSVDGHTCIGSGMCAALLPELFALRGATATALRDEVAPDEEVLDAADSCPASAILVTEEGREIGPRP